MEFQNVGGGQILRKPFKQIGEQHSYFIPPK